MKHKRAKIIIFADLDGTILDESYDYSKIKPIIQKLVSMNVSIILSSSKTMSEIAFYRKKLLINDPFVVENGSAIFIPKSYFEFPYEYSRSQKGFRAIELGCSYSVIREKLLLIKQKTGADIVGFGDMSPKILAKATGLSLKLARLAKKREYDEAFFVNSGDVVSVFQEVANEGLSCCKGGRFYHVCGNCEKGKAVLILKKLYRAAFEKIVTLGVGDSENDLSLLKAVDHSFWVKKEMNKNDYLTAWLRILKVTESLACN